MTDVTFRPEIYREPVSQEEFGVVEKPLTPFERLYNQNWLRKLFVLIVIAVCWELYARWLDNELLVPTFGATVRALMHGVASGVILTRAALSIKVLLMGFGAGVLIAAILTFLAINTRLGNDFLETMTAMFNPLPAIALLPLALIWFGLGTGSLVFVLIHSVLWAVALNTHAGFRSVSTTHRMVGQNYGLRGIRFVTKILIPAAFPSILAGLKIGWAFAWRTLIAAELVFGTTSGQGGLGWYIFEAKNQLDIPEVFAGLLSIILIGLFIENVVFRLIEARTIGRWGMQN
ncbi:MAG TPA: ABC transporter permease [Pseudolabrys sp.]|nr:ABC transporter permease [Pseudolabrys sp.]